MRQNLHSPRIVALLTVQALATLAGLASEESQKVDVEAHIHLVRTDAPKGARSFIPSVVLWLSPISSETQTPLAQASSLRYRMAQKNKSFDPRFLVVPLGSTVEFPNLDPFFHNVFSQFNGKRFDLGLYETGTTKGVRFDQEGVSYIFCNIHPEMAAVIIALATPYYSVSSGSGDIVIHQVPTGNYMVHAWAEGADAKKLDAATRRVSISTSQRDLGTVEIVANGTAAPHKNKFGEDYPPEETPTY
jgi:plastocyanin